MSQSAIIHASMDATIQAFQHVSTVKQGMYEHYGKNAWLRDFRTMGFFVPRQNGATMWMLKKIIAEPDSLMFTRFREQFITNFDGEGNCDVMAPKTSLLSDDVQWRLREPLDLSIWIKRNNYRVQPLKLLILDNSSVIFNNIRINKFYDWLEKSPGVTSETLILRMN